MKISKIPGLNLADDPYEVAMNGLVTADNIDLTKAHKAKCRPGYTEVYSGNVDAMWSDNLDCLFLDGTTLKRLNADYTTTTLATGLTASISLSVVRAFAGDLYWSNGYEIGVIRNGVNQSWGIETPATPVVSQATTGLLSTGRYLVALTYQRGDMEGPASYTALYVGGIGISVTVPTPTDVNIERINLYITSMDGEVLYLANSVLVGAIELEYRGDASELAIPIETEFLQAPTSANDLIFYNGRIWFVTDNILWHTDPYHELLGSTNFMPIDNEAITMVGAVTDGLYVATRNRTYFLRGNDPHEMSISKVADCGAIRGTASIIDAEWVGEGMAGKGLIWTSPKGICIGLLGGQFVNLSKKRVNNLTGERGTSLFRQMGGQNHLVTVLQG